MKIILTGASGLIGKELTLSLLKQNHEVHAIVRNPNRIPFLPKKQIHLEDQTTEYFQNLISNSDVFVHLSGEPVAQRWTSEAKKKIQDSRIDSTRKWMDLIAGLPVKLRPKVWISGSAIGIYGNRGDEILDESSNSGSGFLAELTSLWEKESAREIPGLRQVILRTGVVLARTGGALDKMQPVILGNGNQYISWIHIEDQIRFIEFAISNSAICGVYNLTSPNPRTNRDFAEALGKSLGLPFSIPVSTPESAIRLALGEMAEIVLSSQRVIPNRAIQDGFQFKYSELEAALFDIYKEKGTAFSAYQFIPYSIENVFEFFSQAKNLEKITPNFLGFKIIYESTPNIQENTRIDYQIKVHGVPMTWQTLISKWNPPSHFTDEQIQGPYKKWIHHHHFFPVQGGTLMTDQVFYQLPLGIIGKAFGSRFVGNDIQKIFDYRMKSIQKIFPAA